MLPHRAAIALFLLPLAACDTAPEGATETGESPIEGIILEDDQLGGQLGSASSIALKEGEIKQQQARFIDLKTKFNTATGKKLDGVLLTGRQADILEKMLEREKDVDTQGLLQEILDTRQQINALDDEIDDLKEQLPTPDVVSRGDSHLALATDYLMQNHGLTKEESQKVAERSLLTNNIAPGMEVWHFYVDGVYGTTVTQGTAKVSPFFLNMRTVRKLKRERDEALTLAASLEAEITVLEETRDTLRSDLARVEVERDELQIEADELTREVDLLAEDNSALVEGNQSVWFHIDTARRLREKDVLAPMNLQLKEWRKDLFDQSLDLRSSSSLKVYAEDFGVKKLRKVTLLPSARYKEDTDYQVDYQEGGRIAVIQLDNISKFKDDAFVVVLR
jgi:hypothetical protein